MIEFISMGNKKISVRTAPLCLGLAGVIKEASRLAWTMRNELYLSVTPDFGPALVVIRSLFSVVFSAIISAEYGIILAAGGSMERLYANLTVSMSDFKKNPSKILKDAGAKPVAILNHNKAAFYLVEPLLFEAMMEDLEDIRIAPLVKSRLAERETAVELDIDSL